MKFVIHRRTRQVLRIEHILPNGKWVVFTGVSYEVVRDTEAYTDVDEEFK